MMTPEPLPQDVVLIATADWDAPFWTNKQHTAARLAKRGFRVLYVESLGLRRPSGSRRDLARMARRLARALRAPRRVGRRLWVLSPLVLPFHGRAACRWFNERLLAGALRLATARLGFRRPLLWTYNPLVAPVAARLPHAMLVYHCVDDLSAAPGLPAEAVREGEGALLRMADVVFATSRALERRCAALAPGRTHYLPNVADFEHFAAARRSGPVPPDLAAIARPRIGFIGAISPYKVDFGLVARMAAMRPDWHWVFIGQVGEGQPGADATALRRPNIHLLGPRPYRVLPEYLRGFDVAALPCALNDYTRSMFPLKFFEYLAAGRPVVTTPLEALREYSDACLVAGSAEGFVAAVERVLAGEGPDTAVGLGLARRHTWRRRLDEMLRLLNAAACGGASADLTGTRAGV